MKWNFVAWVLFACIVPLARAEPPKESVAVSIVKYDGLTDLIKKNSGKVILVDCWADYCLPCKKEFPKLVALHNKLAKDGFFAISLSLDELEDGVKDRVLDFLKQKQATCTNLILDEKPEVWQKKFQVEGPPLVIVFNRKGELVKKFVDKEVEYDKIEALVKKLLAEPAK
jgi:thiol-disulfide isomerase/thioredoxin